MPRLNRTLTARAFPTALCATEVVIPTLQHQLAILNHQLCECIDFVPIIPATLY